MKELLQKIEKRMDDFTVKKKLYILPRLFTAQP